MKFNFSPVDSEISVKFLEFSLSGNAGCTNSLLV